MGTCLHCGKNAGLFRGKHAKCSDMHQQGLSDMAQLTTGSILRGDYENLTEELGNIARRSYVAPDDIPKIVVEGWSSAVDECLENSQISQERMKILGGFMEYVLRTYSTDLMTTDAGDKFALGVVVREISEGVRPSFIKKTDQLLINFQSSETWIWSFNQVELWEKRVVQIRRVDQMHTPLYDQFSERFANVDELQHLATGALLATTHNLYFIGGDHTTRIPYTSIVSAVPNIRHGYEDKSAVSITQEGGKIQTFVNIPAQLALSLIILLAKNGRSLRDRGFIGITCRELDNDSEGLRVEEIIHGTPAHTAGLRRGDIIRMIDDVFIRNESDLSKFLISRSPGETVRFTVLRDGKVALELLTLGAMPPEE